MSDDIKVNMPGNENNKSEIGNGDDIKVNMPGNENNKSESGNEEVIEVPARENSELGNNPYSRIPAYWSSRVLGKDFIESVNVKTNEYFKGTIKEFSKYLRS